MFRKKTGKALVMSLVFMMLVSAAACGNKVKTEKADGTSDFTGEFLVSSEEAKEMIEQGNVLVIDGRDPNQEKGGTIEGAVNTDWNSLSTCAEGKAGDENWGLVPNAKEFEQKLQALGITKEQEILVLGQPEDGWGEDGRVLWMLREAGIHNIKMVDGGVSALKDIGVKLKKDAWVLPEKSDMVINTLDKSHDITTEELQENYEDYKIVDVRIPKEYEGATLYGEAQGGRLPGAINIPYTELFQEDGTLKSNEEITLMYEENGIKKDDQVVTYCTGGIRSAYAQLVLEMCGYENTYNYCQSFWRWAVVGEVEK